MHKALKSAGRDVGDCQLVAVSKNQDWDVIEPVLKAGHRVFGENRVQEAMSRWGDKKEAYPDLKLHLIGPLQSNKAAEAVAFFDVIETLDREKIARAVADEMMTQNRTPDLYIQVNIGEEAQKSGIMPLEADDFIHFCQSELKLKIMGLMCIPPIEGAHGSYFALLRKIAHRNGLNSLSMGMSDDYETAIAFGATSVRVGSAIFGSR